MERFESISNDEINEEILNSTPVNTVKTLTSVHEICVALKN